MTYVVSDLHGCNLERFLELLKKAEFDRDDTLYILGDVIDRGNDSVRLLQWILKQSNVEMILGNHEQMMLDCSFCFYDIQDVDNSVLNDRNIRNLMLWKSNGGDFTLDGMVKLPNSERERIMDFLFSLPLYREIEVEGKRFILVHSGLGNFRKDKKLSDYSAKELLWTRLSMELSTFFDDATLIVGHTPTFFYGTGFQGRILKTSTWIDIDCGCARGLDPGLLRLEDMKEFYLKN